jgi:hypothetical protein
MHSCRCALSLAAIHHAKVHLNATKKELTIRRCKYPFRVATNIGVPWHLAQIPGDVTGCNLLPLLDSPQQQAAGNWQGDLYHRSRRNHVLADIVNSVAL